MQLLLLKSSTPGGALVEITKNIIREIEKIVITHNLEPRQLHNELLFLFPCVEGIERIAKCEPCEIHRGILLVPSGVFNRLDLLGWLGKTTR